MIPPVHYVTIKNIAILFISIIVVLFSLYILKASEVPPLQEKSLTLQAELDQINEEIEIETAKLSPKIPNPVYLEEIKKLSKELKGKQQVFENLAKGVSGNTEGFSRHLTGLAKQNVPDLWFTEIVFSKGGAYVLFQGKTVKAKSVPRLLKKLSSEKVFSGVEFSTFEIKQPKVDPKKIKVAVVENTYLQFKLETYKEKVVIFKKKKKSLSVEAHLAADKKRKEKVKNVINNIMKQFVPQ